MLSKRYKSTEVDRRTWLHVPSGTHWSTKYIYNYMCIVLGTIDSSADNRLGLKSSLDESDQR